MAHPQWLNDHQDADDPLSDLRRLGQWLDSADNRSDWHTVRLARATAERAIDQTIRERLGGFTAGEVARLRQRNDEAYARLSLAELALTLAEMSRLRTATTLRSAPDNADEKRVRWQVGRIDTGIRALLVLLTEAPFNYPVETVRTAGALLEPLTNTFDARTATRAVKVLERWADAVTTAVDILSCAPSTRA
ncbi:hypothetical protein ABT093_36870 [Kitasatospora sp. NPDC002551]|uniref:hypothetical protein n=1 Tax=Kitasatospora sp. NPDC002551 TaxID=3154539 RepID=UPI00332767B3